MNPFVQNYTELHLITVRPGIRKRKAIKVIKMDKIKKLILLLFAFRANFFQHF